VGRLWQRRQENVDCAGARAGSKLLYAVVILSAKLMKLVNRPRPYKTPEGTTKALLVHLVRDHISCRYCRARALYIIKCNLYSLRPVSSSDARVP
jgi:hypothetical protein